MYIDVHTHVGHQFFQQDRDQVIQRAIEAGLTAIVENGLYPASNRLTLDLAEKYSQIKPALGIYPVNAVNGLLPNDFPFEVERFDVDQEIDFINEKAAAGKIAAIGECGLDGYWLKEPTFFEQERVLERLIEVAKRHKLPLILHTRKLEQRCFEIMAHHNVELCNYHCYGGRVRLAQSMAEKYGWCFSIPPNAVHNEAFRKMLAELPLECLLTETDAPYLSPEKGKRNEPAYVVSTVKLLAEVRNIDIIEAKTLIVKNFCRLFGKSWHPKEL